MNLPGFAPPTDGIAKPFWDGVERGTLVLPQCSVCGRWQWYPTSTGTCCGGGSLCWVEVSGRGAIHTYTYVRRPFLPGGAADVPFAVVFVDLDDAPGLRLVGNLVDLVDLVDDVDAAGGGAPSIRLLSIGARVDVEFPVVDGRHRPLFRLVPKDHA